MAPAPSRHRPIIKDPQPWNDNYFRVILIIFKGLVHPTEVSLREQFRAQVVAIFKKVFPRMKEYSWRHLAEKFSMRFGAKQTIARWEAIDRNDSHKRSSYSQAELDQFSWWVDVFSSTANALGITLSWVAPLPTPFVGGAANEYFATIEEWNIAIQAANSPAAVSGASDDQAAVTDGSASARAAGPEADQEMAHIEIAEDESVEEGQEDSDVNTGKMLPFSFAPYTNNVTIEKNIFGTAVIQPDFSAGVDRSPWELLLASNQATSLDTPHDLQIPFSFGLSNDAMLADLDKIMEPVHIDPSQHQRPVLHVSELETAPWGSAAAYHHKPVPAEKREAAGVVGYDNFVITKAFCGQVLVQLADNEEPIYCDTCMGGSCTMCVQLYPLKEVQSGVVFGELSIVV